MERTLRRWLELRWVTCRAAGTTYSEGGQRDQRAEVLWASTVSVALAACPHNVPTDRWWSCGSRRRGSIGALLRRASGRLRPEAFEVLVYHLSAGPSPLLVCPAEVWVLVDAEASALDQTVEARERSARRGAATVGDLGKELARREVWLQALELVERLHPVKHAMDWLGERFYQAAAADRTFLRRDEDDE